MAAARVRLSCFWVSFQVRTAASRTDKPPRCMAERKRLREKLMIRPQKIAKACASPRVERLLPSRYKLRKDDARSDRHPMRMIHRLEAHELAPPPPIKLGGSP